MAWPLHPGPLQDPPPSIMNHQSSLIAVKIRWICAWKGLPVKSFQTSNVNVSGKIAVKSDSSLARKEWQINYHQHKRQVQHDQPQHKIINENTTVKTSSTADEQQEQHLQRQLGIHVASPWAIRQSMTCSLCIHVASCSSRWAWMHAGEHSLDADVGKEMVGFNVLYKYNLSYDPVYCQIRCQNSQWQNALDHVSSYASVGNAWVQCKYWVWRTIGQSVPWGYTRNFQASSLPTWLPVPCETMQQWFLKLVVLSRCAGWDQWCASTRQDSLMTGAHCQPVFVAMLYAKCKKPGMWRSIHFARWGTNNIQHRYQIDADCYGFATIRQKQFFVLFAKLSFIHSQTFF